MESKNTHGWENGNLSRATNESNDMLGISLRCVTYRRVDLVSVGQHTPYIVNATINVMWALLAITSNTLVFFATRKTTSIRPPSKLLLCSLILTDLGVGLVAQPLYATFLVAKTAGFTRTACLCRRAFSVVGSMFSSTALATMTLMSLDRCAALFFHLNYKQIVTTNRVAGILALLWLLSVSLAMTSLWNMRLFVSLVLFAVPSCFVVISSAYISIYRGLRRSGTRTLSASLCASRCRRSASNMLWIYGLFMLCYLPYLVSRLCMRFVRKDTFMQLIFEFSMTFLFLNSSMDPFLYCARLPGIRVQVLKTIRKIFNYGSRQVT